MPGRNRHCLSACDGIFIEAKSEAAHDSNDVAGAVLADDSFQNNRALIPRFARFFGVLRLDALNDCGWSNAAADAEDATAKTAAFTRTNAGTFAFANAAALTGSDSATDARSGRWWTGNAQRDRRDSED